VHELGHLAQVHAQHVVQHQHLAGRALARANADGVAVRQLGRQLARRGHHFQHQHGGAGVLQLQRVAAQLAAAASPLPCTR
jgi:hypothetical protein